MEYMGGVFCPMQEKCPNGWYHILGKGVLASSCFRALRISWAGIPRKQLQILFALRVGQLYVPGSYINMLAN